MVFVGAHLARKIERHLAEDRLALAVSMNKLFPERNMVYGRDRWGYRLLLGKDMPLNRLMRLGMRGRFGGGFGIAMLKQFEDNCRFMGVRPSVEICPFTAQPHIDLLNENGYQIDHFENIFVRELTLDEASSSVSPEVVVEPLEADDFETWAYLAMQLCRKRTSTDHPQIQFALAACHSPQTVCFLARLDGEPVGTGAISIRRELASLSFAGIHPTLRNRGVQQALILHSLDYALSNGATLVVTVETPQDTALHNLIRFGFSSAYTRIVMSQRST